MPEDAKTEAAKLQRQFYGNPLGLADHLIKISLNKTAVVYEVFLILDNYSTLEVGCLFINGCDSFQLVKKNRGFILCSDLYKWLTTIRLPITQPLSCAGNAAKLIFLKSAIDTAKPEKDDEETDGNPFYTIDADIILESEAIAVLDKIGPEYFKRVGKKFYVNSGTRTPYRQALAMYIKRESSPNKNFPDYTNRKLADEVLAAIKKAQSAGKNRDGIIQAMTDVIQNQVNNKLYISDHLIAGAIDIAIVDKPGVKALTASEKKIMIEISSKITGKKTIEEKHPPHIHIEYK